MRLIDAEPLKELFPDNGEGSWTYNATAKAYIDAQPTVEAPDINVGNMDTTTHDSIPAETGENDEDRISGDCISRQQAFDALRKMQTYKLFAGDDMLLIDQAEAQTELMMLPPAQPDAITASLEELINDYGEDGYFIVDGVNYQANELLNELKINSSVGEKFRIQITKTIVAYFMKFGD